MEYLLFIAIVLGLTEWRRYQQRAEYRALKTLFVRSQGKLQRLLDDQAKKHSAEIENLALTIRPLDEFIRQAHMDLGAVVKEQHTREREKPRPIEFDVVEGL